MSRIQSPLGTPQQGSNMSLCLAKLAEQEIHEKEAFKRVLIRICDDKEKANNIMSEMLRRGLIERHVVVTERGREAFQRLKDRP